MIFYRQYRPAFFTGFENDEGQVECVPELLRLSFIDHWAKEAKFHRFSLSQDRDSRVNNRLMAEMEDGYVWWVVAIVSDEKGELDSLPKWEPKERD